MTATIACLDCGRQLLLPEDRLDQMVQCPSCAREFIPHRENGEVQLQDMGRALHTDIPAPTYHFETPPAPPTEPHHAKRHHPHPKHGKTHGRRTLGWLIAALFLVGVTVVLFFVFRPTPISVSEWQTFEPAGAGASVLMPGSPISAPFPHPRLKGVRHVLQYDGTTSFVFAYADDPVATLGGAAGDDVLNNLAAEQRNLMLNNTNGKVLYEGNVWLGPHRGREFRIERREPREMALCRLYLVTAGKSSRLYLLAASGPHIEPHGTDADRFFESFKLDE